MQNKRSYKDRKDKLSSVIEQVEVGREKSFKICCSEMHNDCKVQNKA